MDVHTMHHSPWLNEQSGVMLGNLAVLKRLTDQSYWFLQQDVLSLVCYFLHPLQM